MASVLRFDEWQDSDGNAVASAVNGVGAFNASTTITASDASWAVPTLASPIVKVTAIGGGGGGGSSDFFVGGGGGTTTFNASTAGTVIATGGKGGVGSNRSIASEDGTPGYAAGNHGMGATDTSRGDGQSGGGGAITIAYLDLTDISTVNVTIGAGGVGGEADSGDGGRGEVIVEYVAG